MQKVLYIACWSYSEMTHAIVLRRPLRLNTRIQASKFRRSGFVSQEWKWLSPSTDQVWRQTISQESHAERGHEIFPCLQIGWAPWIGMREEWCTALRFRGVVGQDRGQRSLNAPPASYSWPPPFNNSNVFLLPPLSSI